MNYYEKNINSFLSSVASNMSAVYLPAFFVSLIELLEDFYKFDATPGNGNIKVEKTTLKISYPLATAYFLAYLLKIRRQIPTIKIAPTRGKTHDERFLGNIENINNLITPEQIFNSQLFVERGKKLIRDMRDAQNIYPVFEKRCPILECKINWLEMDIVAADTLLTNSILYTKMAELICFQYLSRLTANSNLGPHLEDYFIRGTGRIDFTSTAKNYVITYQGNKCYYCGRTLETNDLHKRPRADHFIPWVFVKISLVENLVYACHDCNSSKSNRLASISLFNKLLQRNAPDSIFWRKYPDEIVNIDERIDRWVRNYYQASEQLGTGWMPEIIA